MLHSRTAKTTTSGQFRQCDRARRTVYIIRQSIIRHGLSARYRLEVHLLWTRAMSITTERRSMGGLRISQFFPAVRPKDSRCSLVFDAIRALQDSFSALAWTRISKHVTIITAVTQLPTAHQCCTQSHYSENRLRETAPFSIFPARAELLAVRSLSSPARSVAHWRPPLLLATASLLGARLLTTLDQAGVQQEHASS